MDGKSIQSRRGGLSSLKRLFKAAKASASAMGNVIARIEPLEERRMLSVNMVADIWPGSGYGVGATRWPSTSMPVSDGGLLFMGNDGIHGCELWRTDGTASGTQMVKDINPNGHGVLSAWQQLDMVSINGTVFFVADDGVHGQELWKSDGTEAGTVMVKDILPPMDIPEYLGAGPTSLTNVNGTLFFRANDGVHGWEWWKSDGAEAGTCMIKDINPAISAGSEPGGINKLAVVGETAYFFADDGVRGNELWKSDGTEAGTSIVADINPNGDTWGTPFTGVNGTLFFVADDDVHGSELWKSDGTAVGTMMVKEINTIPIFEGTYDPIHGDPYERLRGNSFADNLINVNGTVYFTAFDGAQYNLWKSDGTEAGTVQVRDAGQSASLPISPVAPVAIDGQVFFTADDGVHGMELWKTDGTDAGTAMVKDIAPNDERIGDTTAPNDVARGPCDLVAVAGRLFFTANDDVHGRELWETDGTEAGTIMVGDVNRGDGFVVGDEFSATINWLTPYKGELYFTANDGEHGQELWRMPIDPGPLGHRVAPPSGTITGRVFADVNRNGRINRKERGLGKWRVFIDGDNDGILDQGEKSVVTDARGVFAFKGVPIGDYSVRVVAKRGYKSTNAKRGMRVRLKAGRMKASMHLGMKAMLSR